MHQELRHQVKIHRISEKLNKGIKFCISLPFFFLLKIKAEKQQKHVTQEKKNLVQACKVRANLTTRREA
jgi:hypothetical protein